MRNYEDVTLILVVGYTGAENARNGQQRILKTDLYKFKKRSDEKNCYHFFCYTHKQEGKWVKLKKWQQFF